MATVRVRSVHEGAVSPGAPPTVSLVKGHYEYWHYCCDGTDDRGWGCGYRTLQTVCSWVRLQRLHSPHPAPPPPDGHHPSPPLSSSTPHTLHTCASADSHTSKDGHPKHDDIISVIGSGDITSCGDDVEVKHDDIISVIGSGDITSCGDDVEVKHDDIISVIGSGDISSDVESCDGSQGQGQGAPLACSQRAGHRTDRSSAHTNKVPRVPSLPGIQRALVDMGDKPAHFVGSRQWIGSYEVCLCLDFFYDVPCKILHVSRGADLRHHLATLYTHFSTLGGPVMMGGDSDASSKGIMGVCMDPAALLVVDPHYSGCAPAVGGLQGAGWVKWVLLSDFHPMSFYNLCLPQLPARAPDALSGQGS
ncbi:hypothetical protein ACOMHN_014032 [Nucella lapillus]